MFADRVNILLNLIGSTNQEVAERMGCDRSNVSRMRSGGRTPRADGSTARRFSEAVCSLAQDRGCVDALTRLVVTEERKNAPLPLAVRRWLYEGAVPSSQEEGDTIAGSAPYRVFGDRLTAAMELADLTNARFARALSIDASHLSRFRSGLRAPKANSVLVAAISSGLLSRAKEQERLEGLSRLSGIPLAVLSDPEGGPIALRDWLCDYAGGSGVLAERFAGRIDALAAALPPKLPKLTLPPYETASVYYGKDGLRQAVIRFLGEAIAKKAPQLLLYSDQRMDWMTDDPVFLRQWAMAMVACVAGGTRIRIIHNLDRGMEELLAAIDGWLPLYLSGRIESFYCRKLLDNRFSHTIFLCPKMGCIAACHVAGQDSEGMYHYLDDETSLSAMETQFHGLLRMAKPLMRVYRGGDYLPSGSCRITSAEPSLSLATMPQTVLDAMLGSCGEGKAVKSAARAAWKRERDRMEQALGEGFYFECAPLADPGEAETGSIAADLRGVIALYTPETYALHVKEVLRLSREHTNYRFYPLEQPLFSGTRVLLGDQSISVSRLASPAITFSVGHPSMREAFSVWLDRVMRESRKTCGTLEDALARSGWQERLSVPRPGPKSGKKE